MDGIVSKIAYLFAGAGVTFLGAEINHWRKWHAKRKSLANALLVELAEQAHWIAPAANKWCKIAKEGTLVSSRAAATTLPLPSVVYPSVVSNIPDYFDAHITASIVQFYSNISYI